MSLWDEPIRGAAVLSSAVGGDWAEVLLLGFENGDFLVCTPDGEPERVQMGFVRFNWRWAKDHWIDVDALGIPLGDVQSEALQE